MIQGIHVQRQVRVGELDTAEVRDAGRHGIDDLAGVESHVGEHGDVVEVVRQVGSTGGLKGGAVSQSIHGTGLEVAGGVAGRAVRTAFRSVGSQLAAVVHAVAAGVHHKADAVLLLGLAPGGHVLLALGELHVGGLAGGAGDEGHLDALLRQELGLGINGIGVAGTIGVHRCMRCRHQSVKFECRIHVLRCFEQVCTLAAIVAFFSVFFKYFFRDGLYFRQKSGRFSHPPRPLPRHPREERYCRGPSSCPYRGAGA